MVQGPNELSAATLRFHMKRHTAGDPRCSSCAAEWPRPHRCGGLFHGELDADEDGDFMTYRCDSCGATSDDLLI